MKPKEALKFWADIAVSIAIVAGFGTFVYAYFHPQTVVQPTARQQTAMVKAGDVVPKFAAYAGKDKTLVAVMSTACSHCRNSLTMMADLDKQLKAKGSEVAVVLQSAATPSVAAQFLAPAQEVRYMSGMSTADFRIRGTPTFALLDRKGRVLRVWTGELTDSYQPNRTPIQEIEGAI